MGAAHDGRAVNNKKEIVWQPRRFALAKSPETQRCLIPDELNTDSSGLPDCFFLPLTGRVAEIFRKEPKPNPT
jgi:hypothetical protein